MKQIDAKNVIKTIRWISTFENKNIYLEPVKSLNDMYVCEVTIPLVNKRVIGLGNSKIDALNNLTEKCSELIDNYLLNHPCCQFEIMTNDESYLIEEDDKGFLNLHRMQKN